MVLKSLIFFYHWHYCWRILLDCNSCVPCFCMSEYSIYVCLMHCSSPSPLFIRWWAHLFSETDLDLCENSWNLILTFGWRQYLEIILLCPAPSLSPPLHLWRRNFSEGSDTSPPHTCEPDFPLPSHITSSSPPWEGVNSSHHGAVTETKRWTVSALM